MGFDGMLLFCEIDLLGRKLLLIIYLLEMKKQVGNNLFQILKQTGKSGVASFFVSVRKVPLKLSEKRFPIGLIPTRFSTDENIIF
jgi:hypothetical protein